MSIESANPGFILKQGRVILQAIVCAFLTNDLLLHFMYDREKANIATAFRVTSKCRIALPGNIHNSTMSPFGVDIWPLAVYAKKFLYIPNHHFKVGLQYFCQVPLCEHGARGTRPHCAAVLDIYGDHLRYCESGSHIIRRDAQVQLLAGDLAEAARHPIVEERPLGRHRERPEIRALGRTGATDLFDVTIFYPPSQARIRQLVQNSLNVLKAATAKSFKVCRNGLRSRKKRTIVTCPAFNS